LRLSFLVKCRLLPYFFFSSRRRHTRSKRDWSSDVCSSDLIAGSLAHAEMLYTQGILTEEDFNLIKEGLAAVKAEIEAGNFNWSRSEERRVGKECRSEGSMYHI